MFVCVQECVFIYAALWYGARSCYGVATRTCLLYMRQQQFVSKVIVHAVLLLSSPPPSIHTQSPVYVCVGGGWGWGVGAEMGLGWGKGGWRVDRGASQGDRHGKRKSNGRQVKRRRGGLIGG